MGKYAQARKLDEETLARRRRVLGEDHPDTLHSAHNLGYRLWGLRKYAQARQFLAFGLNRLGGR